MNSAKWRPIHPRGVAWVVLAGLFLLCGGGAASTVVAPHALFMDHSARSTVLYIYNTGDQPQEVSVDLCYGYPSSDEAGQVRVNLIEEPGAAEPYCPGAIAMAAAGLRAIQQ